MESFSSAQFFYSQKFLQPPFYLWKGNPLWGCRNIQNFSTIPCTSLPSKASPSLFAWRGNPSGGCRNKAEIFSISALFLKDFSSPPLAVFLASLSTDFLEKPGKKFANGDHNIAGHLATDYKCELFAKHPKCHPMTIGGGECLTFHNGQKCFVGHKAPFRKPS